MKRAALAPIAATIAVAGVLAGAAVITVAEADCEDPGRYVQQGSGYELVGGCLEAGDLPVGPAISPSDDEPADEPRP